MGGSFPLFPIAAVFIPIVFLMGGGARQDVQSLVILRPIAAIVLALVILKGPPPGPANNRFVRLVAAACVGLAAIHLIPLPPALWSLLPGRDIIERIDEAAGIAGTWRPIAMVPPSAWNALFALLVPAAALAIALRLQPAEHGRVAAVLLLAGLASVSLGILQMLGGDGSPFYLYRIQNTGQLAGLFANRNHQAIFLACLLPVIGFLASRPVETVAKFRLRLAGLALIVLFISSALVVASSRAGFVLGIVGAIAAIALFRYPRIARRTHQHAAVLEAPGLLRWQIAGGALVVALAASFYLFGSSAIGERIAGSGGANEDRVQFWPPIISAIWDYFPIGSGNGSFVEVYEIVEPASLIRDNYLNHAHNDFLETALTLGLPGIAILLAVVAAWLRASLAAFRSRDYGQTAMLARVGAVIGGMLALASAVDYPLRTPSLACLFVFASVWLAQGYSGAMGSNEERFE